MSLIDAVMSELDSGHVEAVAQRFGIPGAQAQGAIEQALPLLVGALARSSASPEGAQALHSALDAHAGLDVGGLLGSVFGGGSAGGGGLAGVLGSVLGGGMGSGTGSDAGGGMGDVLGQILGARQRQASQGLGQTSGLGTQNAGELLAMLAPVVMAAMARLRQQQGLGAADLGRVLGGDAQRVQQGGGVAGGLLGAVLDRDGDGDVDLSDLMAVGGSLLAGRGRA